MQNVTTNSVFLQDFGDGGAFPEIHVAQFPLEMGRKKMTCNSLAVQVDAEGKVKYDAIARQGQSKDKVYRLRSLLYKDVLIFKLETSSTCGSDHVYKFQSHKLHHSNHNIRCNEKVIHR